VCAGDSALILAVKGKSIEIVELLLQQEGININSTNNDGQSALMVAAQSGQMEIVRMLCERPDINYDIIDNDVLLFYIATRACFSLHFITTMKCRRFFRSRKTWSHQHLTLSRIGKHKPFPICQFILMVTAKMKSS
jgi:ankyrin repeat protein